ncbi:MAG: hypothetical protein WC728_05675 [Elusimicrobiota bacterium]
MFSYLSLIYGKDKAAPVLSGIETLLRRRGRIEAPACSLSERSVLLASGPVPKALAGLVEGVPLDVEVNSVPPSHPWFQRCLKDDPECAALFIRCDPYGDAGERSLTPFVTPSGQRWYRTTGASVDLDYRHPQVLLSMLDLLLSQQAPVLRLLHASRLWGGTHLPETHALVRVMRAVLEAARPGTLVAVDVDDSPAEEAAYLGNGDEAHLIHGWPFALLAGHAILSGDARALSRWVQELPSPPNRCARLFSTSGELPLRHVRGLLPESGQDMLLEAAKSHGGSVAPGGVVRSAFMDLISALGDPDPVAAKKFLLSQAMLLAMPGVPLLSPQGLLGSRNNQKAVPVFEGCRRMLAVRVREPGFSPLGPFRVLDLDRTVFALERHPHLLAAHNVDSVAVRIRLKGKGRLKDLLSGETLPADRPLELGPYEFRWLKPL